jgi:heat-inducible transcriptional repressor
MKNTHYKSLLPKKAPKNDREITILLGLIELYLRTAKPVSSQALQEDGFDAFSTATIRNYFATLEELGCLKQQHTSGGRIPTEKGFRLYADTYRSESMVSKQDATFLKEHLPTDTKEVATFVHQAANILSELTNCAVFLSSPRFDQDFIQDVRLIQLAPLKILSILITDFGLIKAEPIYLEQPIEDDVLKVCEKYFLWRVNRGEKPSFSDEAQAKAAQRIYNEVMVRYVVSHTTFAKEDIYKTGLSKLLSYPEFADPSSLAGSLSLLENETHIQSILKMAAKKNDLIYWIGNDLSTFSFPNNECSIISIPYYINNAVAGAIALFGPTRLPYRHLFGIMRMVSQSISETLSESVQKHKITFRHSSPLAKDILGANSSLLIENQYGKETI